MVTPVLALVVVLGLVGAVPRIWFQGKTEAPVFAQALRAQALPGDVVVYCPDQLGPDTSRLLPSSLHQEVYPSGASPERVDWIDYEMRNRAADPGAYARDLSSRAGAHAIWLVSAYGYRTLENQCEVLAETLVRLRGAPLQLADGDPFYLESGLLRGWAPPQPVRR